MRFLLHFDIMTFQEKLENTQDKNNSLLCVGLDPVLEKIPEHLQEDLHPFFSFNKAIIDETNKYVCAYKPNSAFYEALGSRGVEELKFTCDYLRIMYPHIPLIIDAKRADIGNTNEGYAQYIFDYLQADAVTLQPYLGREAIAPFLDKEDKGIIILCRTSNPGAGEFQDLQVACAEPAERVIARSESLPQPLYIHVAQQVVQKWNKNNNCLLVVGATYPEELASIRKIAGDMTFLIPGVGAQGGEVKATLKAGLNSKKKGMIISSSRGIIFAGSGQDFAKRAGDEAKKLRDEINIYR